MPNPLILGHRGASQLAPENTLSAFRLARELGADGVELDVQLSRDRVPVVIHDGTLERTTDGHGAVSAHTVLELKQLDAGAWKAPQFRGERIPTLAEVFEVLSDWLVPTAPRGAPRGLINVELKSNGIFTDGLEREVVNLIAQKNAHAYVLVSSFNPLMLQRVKAMDPRLKRGLLYSPEQPAYLSRAWLRLLVAPHALHPKHTMIDYDYAEWARARRYAINTWTVDEPAEAARLANLKVNAIITNQPDLIRRAIEATPRQEPDRTPKPPPVNKLRTALEKYAERLAHVLVDSANE